MRYGNGRPVAPGRVAAGLLAAATLVSAVALTSTPSAFAAISSPSAGSVANALAASGTAVTNGSWASIPAGDGTPDGVSTTPMAGFPTEGSSFAILTTGDVNSADDAPPSTHTGTTTDLAGGNVRGDTDFDVSILKIDFTVGERMNCVRFDFRFLSEEYPEFLNSKFNDAFIAELDTSDWSTSGSTISAPHNFAFDPNHKVISINAAGNTSMSAGPADTTYDGATPILTAADTVTPGNHSLYLSIFDQGDHRFDSAVFVDNLVVGHAADPSAQCAPGAAPKTFALALTPASKTLTVGATHTVTATVTDVDPGPVSGGTVLFAVSGANTATGTATSDANGHASFHYTGTATGTDAITACYDLNTNGACDSGEVFASVAATWKSAPASPTPTSDSPGLPTTGAPTGLIAGLGVLLLAAGAATLFFLRRRRVGPTAE